MPFETPARIEPCLLETYPSSLADVIAELVDAGRNHVFVAEDHQEPKGAQDMTAASSVATQPSKALNISLWIVQGLLAAAFTMAGIMKSTQPLETLATNMPWTGAVPPALVRFIGVSELAGGLGLILPAATRIRPLLTPLAATGLLTIMVLAAGFHIVRGEPGPLVNLVLGALAAFVAWGRFKKAPIQARYRP